ncbi:MAG: hypothetical protein K8W52_16755 [Deltaproteobacteria bacterium]|nr:hypothetical protein [Deltaproteobacteria bacterium]
MTPSLAAVLHDVLGRERSRIVGALYRLCGGLDAAEEALQEALVAALATWPTDGVPDNPAAWLTTAARRHALDGRRRRGVAAAKAPMLMEDPMAAEDALETIHDDQLRLIFTCCHPALPRDGQVALTLKVILGFTIEELARAFVCAETTMAQRIVRAKRTIEDKQLAYASPGWRELPGRTTAVLEVLYLIFNEGHTARTGALARLDLQAEALRLARLVSELLPREPEASGLLALMAFGVARAATRADAEGVLVRLEDQDRDRWDLARIEEGLFALRRARTLGGRGSYVLQAEIAACHTTAPTWAATDWDAITRAYDELLALGNSPVVALNRAVAISMREGAVAGLVELAPLAEILARYHLFYATRAELLRRLGRDPRPDYERALALTQNASEQAFLRRQIASLDS